MEIDLIDNLNASMWGFLENSLLPPHKDTARFSSKWCFTTLKQMGSTLVALPLAATTGILAATQKMLNIPLKFFSSPSEKDPRKDFTAVVDDSRQWDKLANIREELLRSPPGATNKDFLYGTASCTYQDSGYVHCPNSQWHPWEKKTLSPLNQSGQSANLFELYQKDPQAVIDKLLQLEVTSYRTSIEWSQIEPSPGVFDDKALQVYVDFCKLLLDYGIEPMITLHHFSEPKWFHDKGSFENEENIIDFVRFSQRVYTKLTEETKVRSGINEPLVKYFCTINEPAIEAFSRFVRGSYSPGVVADFQRAACFLKGALKAHCAVYETLKNLPPKDTKIGFTHQYLRFIPDNILVYPAVRYLNALINDATLNLFKTQTFSVQVPLECHVVEKFDQEKLKTDFIGVQYYTRPIIGLTGSVSSHSEEAMTSMPFREDPAGLYEAITETHKAFNAPVIVTENGISTHDPVQRERYMTRALYALKQAELKLGSEALLGYYQWCLVNNFEWDMGMEPQAFGAFDLKRNLDGTAEIAEEPKEGMDVFIETIDAWHTLHEPSPLTQPQIA